MHDEIVAMSWRATPNINPGSELREIKVQLQGGYGLKAET